MVSTVASSLRSEDGWAGSTLVDEMVREVVIVEDVGVRVGWAVRVRITEFCCCALVRIVVFL